MTMPNHGPRVHPSLHGRGDLQCFMSSGLLWQVFSCCHPRTRPIVRETSPVYMRATSHNISISSQSPSTNPVLASELQLRAQMNAQMVGVASREAVPIAQLDDIRVGEQNAPHFRLRSCLSRNFNPQTARSGECWEETSCGTSMCSSIKPTASFASEKEERCAVTFMASNWRLRRHTRSAVQLRPSRW